MRVDETKSTAGRRTILLPTFAIDMLEKRRQLHYVGEHPVIFPSTSGTLRDPNNFGKEWRTARQELGVAEVTTHSFRKTVEHLSKTKDSPLESVPITSATPTSA